jgi:outer membrane murein-binding lipoprotein Lpp
MQSRLNSLRADFDALQHDVRGLASDVGDAASSQVQDAIDTASGAVDRVSEWGTENLNGVRSAVKSQPLAACMLSMSAGALIGALLLR